MTKEETLSLLHKIKAHYQEFALEDYVINEWYDKLEPYEYQDLLKKFDYHLNSEFRNKYPRLNYMVAGLLTPEEKLKVNVIRVKCSICGKTVNYLDHDKHLGRHSSVYYIKSREHYLDKHFNEEQMMTADDKKFDKFYNDFLAKLYERIENGSEKERLRNILTCLE